MWVVAARPVLMGFATHKPEPDQHVLLPLQVPHLGISLLHSAASFCCVWQAPLGQPGWCPSLEYMTALVPAPSSTALPHCRGQAGTLGTGKRLLTTMQRHANWDRLTLWGGLAVFMLVVAYVVQKRSLYFVPR